MIIGEAAWRANTDASSGVIVSPQREQWVARKHTGLYVDLTIIVWCRRAYCDAVPCGIISELLARADRHADAQDGVSVGTIDRSGAVGHTCPSVVVSVVFRSGCFRTECHTGSTLPVREVVGAVRAVRHALPGAVIREVTDRTLQQADLR